MAESRIVDWIFCCCERNDGLRCVMEALNVLGLHILNTIIFYDGVVVASV